MAKRTSFTRRVSPSVTSTPASRPRLYSDRGRNQWSTFEQENVPVDRGGSSDRPYKPSERLFDREKAAHLVFQSDDENLSEYDDHSLEMNHEIRTPIKS